MKKFLSLTVALAMTVAMVPATAFAKSDMKISRQITAESNDLIYDGSNLDGQTKATRVAPILTLTADGSFRAKEQTFRLKLTNAEWLSEEKGGKDVTFESNGKDRITVKDTNTGEYLIGGKDTTTPPEDAVKAARDALQDALNKDRQGSTTGDVKFTAAEYKEVLDTAIRNKKIDNLDNATDIEASSVVTGMKLYMSKAAIAFVDGADGTAAWGKATTATAAHLNAKKASEKARKIALDEDGTEKDKVTAEIDKVNTELAGQDIPDINDINFGDLMKDYAEALTAAKGVVDTAITDLFASSRYNTEADTDTLKSVFSTYVKLEAAAVAAEAATEKALAIETQQVEKLALAAGSGTPSQGEPLVADTVLGVYTKNKSELELKRYLADERTQDANIARIVELTIAYSKALEGGVTPPTPGTDKGTVTVERVTDTLAMVTIITDSPLPDDAEVNIPLYTKITGGETATVEVDPRDSEFSSDSKTFAKVSEGSTTSFVDTTKNFYDGDTLNTIYIDENAAGTFEIGKTITLKLSSGFKWGDSKADLQANKDGKIKLLNGDGLNIDYSTIVPDGNEITFKLTGTPSKNPATISLSKMIIKEDGADFGTTAKVTVSGAGITKKLVELGTYSDFGITLTAESKALPLIYAGSFDEDNETLRVTFEETVQSSWITDRKTEFTLPEDVKFVSVEVKKTENMGMSTTELENHLMDNIDGNKTSISARTAKVPDGKKGKFEAIFEITADPSFTGDVELTAGGPAVGAEKLSKAVATVASPLTVKSSVNEVKIDYRNVDVNSITITEAEAGLWEKGDKITLEVEEMQFESGIKAEIVTGDMKLEKLDGDNVKVNKKAGTVTIQVKSTSSSTPAEIKIDGIKLYLDRSLPVGDYELSIVTTDDDKFVPGYNNKEKDLLFANFHVENKDWDGGKKDQVSFDTDSVVVLKDFVKVVTAGRDQGDGFTTKLVVPVGSDKIMAGTNEITIDAPAYINADGYTMLPVRAVIDALNGIAVVRWDDASKTCTISYANKVFAMTVGSKTMNMNGVSTALLAAPEIKNERIFLPLRDLGYALGLSDSKIAWDPATNTATLN